MLKEITLDEKYLITDGGTSDGTQIKYFKRGKWYKQDRWGGEGEAEELASELLKRSTLRPEDFVNYSRVRINGIDGCVSDNFLAKNEEFITFYRLYLNTTGNDLSAVTARMDYDDAIDYVINYIYTIAGVDISSYLADIFALDELILNEDRHFNNIGLIYNGECFRPAPIFDNGKSFFVGNKSFDPCADFSSNRKKAYARAFSGSFALNRKYLADKATVEFDFPAMLEFLTENAAGYSERAVAALTEQIKRLTAQT